MIFHDVTKFPGTESDRVLRMKHIGNDHIHIVWYFLSINLLGMNPLETTKKSYQEILVMCR